jgi:radical SAM superfamily enzyme YgiQ (UPF0313 family)
MGSRRVLCVFPRYAPSFGTFSRAYDVMGGVKAFMPPLGLLTIAAYLPDSWDISFIDENIRPAIDAELTAAEIVFVSGMHVQRSEIQDIGARARKAGATTVLGGSSASAAPDWYPDFDYLHVGELGDATDRLIERLASDPSRPAEQIRFETDKRLPIESFPVPAWRHIDMRDYFIGALQYTSGCPYRCEFCDIPGLYGRVPRIKSPRQVIAELDGLMSRGAPNAVYFVDDNFVGNRKAAKALLPALIDWQKSNGYPVQLNCEATLNLARDDELLAMMRDAYFITVFCGIESPDADALEAMDKSHNMAMPISEAIAKLNSYGMEVVSGIIIGLDTDVPETAGHIIDFAQATHIPMLTVNLLQALPKTPLWDRLQHDGRIVDDPWLESNVRFNRPYASVLGDWRRCMEELYRPEALWERLAWNAEHTYPNRIKPPPSSPYRGWTDAAKGLKIAANLLYKVGLAADWRRLFWKHAAPLLARGDIREALHMAVISHHLIGFARDAVAGETRASFYAA